MYRFSGGRFGSTPPVTKNLIIINVVMLLGTMVLQQTGVNLNALLGMYYFQSPLFAPWQIVTHMFMHGGIGHIFFNMYALWIFGKNPGECLGEQTLPDLLPGYWIGCGIFPSAGELHSVCP
jgi:membrane associated rhomboid family serine protease